ncbi:MAG: thiamine diphosphokinase [Oscillospiraceae bacterium]|nr:thiamine diphosphokinase [Oscillospiraceae bacterium]
MPICLIAGAAPEASPPPEPVDFIIAADGGYRHLARWGLRPDLLLGDMDSLEDIPAGIPLRRYPPEKDDTDLALALREGMARGYRDFLLTGVCGGRPDMTAAAFQILLWAARQGLRAELLAAGFRAAALPGPGTLRLRGKGTVSVLAAGGPAKGVAVRGLRYPLEGATLREDIPLGVSNELDGEGTVSLAEGALLVFREEGITAERERGGLH